MDSSVRLGLLGALLLLIAAILVPVADSENAMTGVVLGVIAVGLGVWIWRTGSRAAWITSMVFGVLLVLAFGLFVLGDASSDSVDALVVAADVLAVVAGACLIAGAVMSFRDNGATKTV